MLRDTQSGIPTRRHRRPLRAECGPGTRSYRPRPRQGAVNRRPRLRRGVLRECRVRRHGSADRRPGPGGRARHRDADRRGGRVRDAPLGVRRTRARPVLPTGAGRTKRATATPPRRRGRGAHGAAARVCRPRPGPGLLAVADQLGAGRGQRGALSPAPVRPAVRCLRWCRRRSRSRRPRTGPTSTCDWSPATMPMRSRPRSRTGAGARAPLRVGRPALAPLRRPVGQRVLRAGRTEGLAGLQNRAGVNQGTQALRPPPSETRRAGRRGSSRHWCRRTRAIPRRTRRRRGCYERIEPSTPPPAAPQRAALRADLLGEVAEHDRGQDREQPWRRGRCSRRSSRAG